MMRRVAVTLAALVTACVSVAQAKEWTPEQEARIGRETLAAVLKEYGEFSNPDATARVQRVVDAVAPRSPRPDVKYEVHLLNDDKSNALSIPGGFICVTRGLLGLNADGSPAADYGQAVESDDELAGVLAHEIAHNCRYDALRESQRDKKLTEGSLLAIVAAIAVGAGSSEVAAVVQGSQLYRQGILSEYSVEVEAAADRAAVDYLLGSSYSPVGLLTYMERGAARYRSQSPGSEEVVSPYVELGVYQTHPYPLERAAMLRNYLHEHGVTINRRATTQWQRADVQEGLADGVPVAHLFLWGQELYRFYAPSPEGQTAVERANRAAEVLNGALAAGLREDDLVVEAGAEEPRVEAMGEAMLQILRGDAVPAGMSPQELGQDLSRRLSEALFQERLRSTFTSPVPTAAGS